MQQSLVELYTQLEALQTEIRQLRGQVEVQTHELERLKSRQQDALVDFDRRLRELERRAQSPSSTEPGGSVTTPPVGGTIGNAKAASARTTAPTSQEQQAYDAAFGLLKQGLYDQAGKAFGDFIAQHPRSALADNAQYWVAEAAYVRRDFRAALDGFNRVMTVYPDSPKVPDALLKLGYTHHELGAYDKAREVLNQVIARYPNTSVAKSAEQRLSKLPRDAR
ncbi:tol-pal system protein YbgF [Sulfurifustis variabilis]|nr:tol-pal system protein YbgF [Sulfurifustis variabilis]